MKVFFVYLLVISTFVFILAGYDKYLARKNKRRIPENTLFFLEAIGGTIGLLLAMLFFRHKTSKASFIIKFSAIIFIQILIAVLLLIYKNDISSVAYFLTS